ncbi:MAG: multicopper oxidase domain-containing protein [Verrucomicrobia bacterium]|nr:multicopper oxidase domain-containing protein [Verrucomicrobiota bacterium]
MLDPPPQTEPLPGEARTRAHQALDRFPPTVLYESHARAGEHSFHPDLPTQTIWGYEGMFPGPTIVARYGEPVLVRNINELPDDNGGFGMPSVAPHLHSGHQASESDGFPCDFFEQGQFYDQHYPNVLAGFLREFPPNGDPREMQSTFWRHDHRLDFTAQNTYKGLAGFYLLFGSLDTGDETTGLRLPSGEFDVPMAFADKVFDENGKLFFDLFNTDGILGDKFTVNGKIQPYFQVHPRKYRLRWLNTGPARTYDLFITDPRTMRTVPVTRIANDSNLLPAPVIQDGVRLAAAERADVIIDFAPYAGQSLILENRLPQDDGRKARTILTPAGRGDALVRFDVVLPAVEDSPPLPARLLDLPTPDLSEVVQRRTFRFDRRQGQWTINGRIIDCDTVDVAVREGTAEIWTLQINAGGWSHPIHIHLEEFFILTRNGQPPPAHEMGRKDVVDVKVNETVQVFMKFRDFTNRYVMHCHNVLHEDHAMMLRFDVVP